MVEMLDLHHDLFFYLGLVVNDFNSYYCISIIHFFVSFLFFSIPPPFLRFGTVFSRAHSFFVREVVDKCSHKTKRILTIYNPFDFGGRLGVAYLLSTSRNVLPRDSNLPSR